MGRTDVFGWKRVNPGYVCKNSVIYVSQFTGFKVPVLKGSTSNNVGIRQKLSHAKSLATTLSYVYFSMEWSM